LHFLRAYCTDNNDDELSHAAFLNAYLSSHGAEPVNLDRFRHLPGSTATGVDKRKIGKRLTNLLSLNVDLSWYTRYRSEENPDLGAIFKGPVCALLRRFRLLHGYIPDAEAVEIEP
jgi:hypothetical protein